VLLSETAWRQPVLKETLSVSQGTPVKNSLISLFQEKDTLYRVLDYYRPDYIHFCESLTDKHGREMDLDRYIDLQVRIRERFPEVGIIRSIPIPEENAAPKYPTLKIAERMEPVSDLFLTDTWLEQEPVEGFIGITGRRCDWRRARELVLQSKIPVILAGGLSPDNVYEGLMEVAPRYTEIQAKETRGIFMRVVLTLTTLLYFLLCLGCGDEKSENNPQSGNPAEQVKLVKVSSVKAAPLLSRLEYVGALSANLKVKVATEIGGSIEKLFFERGARVKEDQLLAEVGTSSILIEVQQAEAALGVARSRLKKTERGSRPEEISIAKARVEEAKAGKKGGGHSPCQFGVRKTTVGTCKTGASH
jgi:phosphoribosylanthranilate isomerase